MKRILASLIFAASAFAFASAAAGDELQASIDRILSRPSLKGASISVRVLELPGGRVLYSYHPDEVLSVASNAKVITTSAVLDALGSKFELTTTLVARGQIRNGVLYGDLVVVGRGDPSISVHWYQDVMAPLRRFAQEAAANGIQAVTGDVLAEDSYFDQEFWCPSWPRDQWIQWYQAPVAALAFNDNCVDVVVGPGPSEGAPASLVYYPAVGYVNLTTTLTTTSSRKRHGYSFYRTKFDNNVTARGAYYLRGAPVQDNFTVYDPGLYLCAALRKALEDNGVAVRGVVRRLPPAETVTLNGARVIAVNRVSLAEVVKYCNLNSQNLYAEMLLKTVGREVVGEGGFDGGARAVAKFLLKLDVLPGTYNTADGSGLSRETKYTAKALTEVLMFMYKSPDIVAFRDSLPLAGFDGTMEGRLGEQAYRGKVRAKTGYILGTSALSGYALTANGKTVAFSMVFNNFKGSNRWTIKPIQDDVCRAIVDSRP